MEQVARRINDLLSLDAEHPLYNTPGTWFHLLKRFPAVLIDASGYISFTNAQDYQSKPGIKLSPTHTHIKAGIASLDGYRPFSDSELELLLQHGGNLIEQETPPIDEKTLRRKRQVNALVRNQKHVQSIKTKYKDTCQICGLRMEVRPGRYYSEVHHIKPLGQKHDGADVKANMLCVCPNHHALLDFFAIRLEVDTLLLNDHALDEAYVAYHNEQFDKYNP